MMGQALFLDRCIRRGGRNLDLTVDFGNLSHFDSVLPGAIAIRFQHPARNRRPKAGDPVDGP
jgi:hypothetical protein